MNKWMVMLALLAVSTLVVAQYNLQWGAFTNGGTEFPNWRTGGGYKLADNLGRGTSSCDTVLSDGGATYYLYPGYRYVELDLRNPLTWMADSLDTIATSPSFIVSWEAVDTTLEDGYGWGIRYYDIDYRVNPTGAWLPWFAHITFSSALFGPSSPVVVAEESIYFFRVKAYDLATNEEAYPVAFDRKVQYQPASVSFLVYNPTSDTAIWDADTTDPGQTRTMDPSEVLVVKNPNNDTLVLAVRAFPFALDTTDNTPYWTLGNYAGLDTFALRARFSDDPTPPPSFSVPDIVTRNFIYTDAGAGYYGGLTHGILYAYGTGDSVAFSENLWMQLHVPTMVTLYGDTVVYQFTVQLKGRHPIP